MSWSFWAEENRAYVTTELETVKNDYFKTWEDDQYAKQEMMEQAASAIDAVESLLDGTGIEGDRVRVNLAGHANEGHGKSDAWANEYVTVSVYVQ